MAYIKNIDDLINLINYIYGHVMHQKLSIFLLQDLLYVSQGFCLSTYNEPLFDDNIVAQAHGPHVSSVDWKLRGTIYLKPIERPNNYIKSVHNALHNDDYTNSNYKVGKIIHYVFSHQGYYKSNGNVLGLFLSRNGTPYNTVIKHIEDTREHNPFEDDYPDLYTVIPKNLIKEYFSETLVKAL